MVQSGLSGGQVVIRGRAPGESARDLRCGGVDGGELRRRASSLVPSVWERLGSCSVQPRWCSRHARAIRRGPRCRQILTFPLMEGRLIPAGGEPSGGGVRIRSANSSPDMALGTAALVYCVAGRGDAAWPPGASSAFGGRCHRHAIQVGWGPDRPAGVATVTVQARGIGPAGGVARGAAASPVSMNRVSLPLLTRDSAARLRAFSQARLAANPIELRLRRCDPDVRFR
jgi:hypothetical protein